MDMNEQRPSWLSDNIKSVLAIIVVVFGFGYFYMCSIRNIKPDPQILIAMVASVSGVMGYYYGSSSSSSKKDDTISTAMSAGVPADNPKPAVVNNPPQTP